MATNSQFPQWTKVTPDAVAADLPRLLDEAEADVASVENSGASDYEGIVCALNDATRPLFRTWSYLAHMLSVMNSPEWRKVKSDFTPRVVAFALRIEQSRAIFDALRRTLTAGGLSPVQKRIVEKRILSAELAGVGLEGEAKARFNEISERLAQLATDFSDCVIDATKSFSYEKGGVTYTIDDAHFPETMKTCADREVRERLYRARSTRAPENTVRIAEILKLRAELASLLGFEDYAHYSLATKCAPDVESVYALIDEMDVATAAKADEEDRELEEIAKDVDPAIGKVEPWDRAFLAEKLRTRKYAYSEEELKRYFEFADVLDGLFRMAKFLFGIDVNEVTGDAKPEVWHPDVRFFEVVEDGKTVAHFYLDPYVRNGLKNGGAWMNEFENRDDRRGTKPLALLSLNLKPADAEGKTLLPMREVETLFHEFGHALQCMLTRIGDEDAAGINLVEWDAVEVASQFMENWCLDDRTGVFVPEELKAKVKAAKNFRAASMCRRQMSFSKIDMKIHSKSFAGDANAVKEEEFAHFGMPSVEGDIFLNSFTHIFAGGYSAGYYGYKWSEVMSGDCYGAFEEAGLSDDEAVRKTGAAYRETILALGGSMSAYEVFIKFRGRKPNSAALLRQQGLA